VIEQEGREHDASIRSPSATLSVRGTQVTLFDQPPYTPRAISLSGQARFGDLKKRMAFGGKRPTVIRADQPTPADAARAATVVDPAIARARTESEEELITDLVSHGAVSFFDPIRGIRVVQGGPVPTLTSLMTTLPGFNVLLSWTGPSDLNLSVASQQTGVFLYPAAGLNQYPDGAHIPFDHRGGGSGGFEVASFPAYDPTDSYIVAGTLVSGPRTGARLAAFTAGQLLPLTQDDPFNPKSIVEGQVEPTETGRSVSALIQPAGFSSARSRRATNGRASPPSKAAAR
jgi:hypothetical protein